MKDENRISAEETKLMRVTWYAKALTEFNKMRTGISGAEFASKAIMEKWEKENPNKILNFEGGKVVGMFDKP